MWSLPPVTYPAVSSGMIEFDTTVPLEPPVAVDTAGEASPEEDGSVPHIASDG